MPEHESLPTMLWSLVLVAGGPASVWLKHSGQNSFEESQSKLAAGLELPAAVVAVGELLAAPLELVDALGQVVRRRDNDVRLAERPSAGGMHGDWPHAWPDQCFDVAILAPQTGGLRLLEPFNAARNDTKMFAVCPQNIVKLLGQCEVAG